MLCMIIQFIDNHEYDVNYINFILCNMKLMEIKLIAYLSTGNQQL